MNAARSRQKAGRARSVKRNRFRFASTVTEAHFLTPTVTALAVRIQAAEFELHVHGSHE